MANAYHTSEPCSNTPAPTRSSLSFRRSLSSGSHTVQRPLVVPTSAYSPIDASDLQHPRPTSSDDFANYHTNPVRCVSTSSQSPKSEARQVLAIETSSLDSVRAPQSPTGSNQQSYAKNRRHSLTKRLSGSLSSFTGLTNTQSGGISLMSGRRSKSPFLPSLNTSDLSQSVVTDRNNATPTLAVSNIRSQYATPLSPAFTRSFSPEQTLDHHSPASSSLDQALIDPHAAQSPSAEDQTDVDPLDALDPMGIEYSHQPEHRTVNTCRIPKSKFSPRVATFGRQIEHRNTVLDQNPWRNSASSDQLRRENPVMNGDHQDGERQHKRKLPSQKSLLSKALAKANDAVVLDGLQDLDAAIRSYGDACYLLRQVMVRSAGEEDRQKLDAVRNTYKNRILELKTTSFYGSRNGYAISSDSPNSPDDQISLMPFNQDGFDSTGIVKTKPLVPQVGSHENMLKFSDMHPQEQALPHSHNLKYSSQPQRSTKPSIQHHTEGSLWSQGSEHRDYSSGTFVDVKTPIYENFARSSGFENSSNIPEISRSQSGTIESSGEHWQMEGGRDTSWLKTINESSSSATSSIPSPRSPFEPAMQNARLPSDGTEAEFDAALNAAIETAYTNQNGIDHNDDANGGEEVAEDYDKNRVNLLYQPERQPNILEDLMRQAQREASIARTISHRQPEHHRRLDRIESFRHDGDKEDSYQIEAQKFETMNSQFDLRDKAAPPRQSDSSDLSGRTWGSFGSNPTSAGTSLSTVAELIMGPSNDDLKDNPLPPCFHSPAYGGLPAPPTSPAASDPRCSSFNTIPNGHVIPRNQGSRRRSRRISISKTKLPTTDSGFGSIENGHHAEQFGTLRHGSTLNFSRQAVHSENDTASGMPLTPQSSNPFDEAKEARYCNESPQDATIASRDHRLSKITTSSNGTIAQSIGAQPQHLVDRTSIRLRKALSNTNMRKRSYGSGGTEGLETSSVASFSLPRSNTGADHRVGLQSPAFPCQNAILEAGGLPFRSQQYKPVFIFDNNIHARPDTRLTEMVDESFPKSLEPCPNSGMLRPYWFLRVTREMIVNPHGAYLTNRLFVPQDMWRVKNLKLKNVEEKITSCDSLSAALLHLSRMEIQDAEMMLQEMHVLEGVTEQVQVSLSKKLGTDVGSSSILSSLKEAGSVEGDSIDYELNGPAAAISNSAPGNNHPAAGNSKSYLKSFQRRLRPKHISISSSTAAVAATTTLAAMSEASEATLKSLPMTNASLANAVTSTRQSGALGSIGPHSGYMDSLARLCDAAQILDRIARKDSSSDWDLRATSSPTHAGLQISSRRLAEFFGFYVCRFVLTDIGLMLDKFVKRNSEWVLA